MTEIDESLYITDFSIWKEKLHLFLYSKIKSVCVCVFSANKQSLLLKARLFRKMNITHAT